ncbi:SulP family inorganic anion transporter [Caenimonas sp. SL110]|uniref:SulP family inorganic anion transporter n=1 Tax=Caenimonas sp. SL110 TaxID=1450524 RepID=UPI000653C82A|nr:SulP family inorganic anion transporter [Caenimonas sp. SL110]
MTSLHRWFPFLKWPRPDAALMRNEIIAGITVALVMVPQCVAYAALAGMPLVTGLYAGLLPPLVAVMFGSSTRLSVGPAALTCILTATSLTGLAEPGSAQWVALAVWLAIMSGVIQFALGAGGFAWVLNLVSSPVLLGFTQAAALLIIASQLPMLIGVKGSLVALLNHPAIDVGALAFGVCSFLMLVAGKKYAARVPMVVVVMAAAGLVSWLSGYSTHGAIIGALPSQLPSLYWPGWPGAETMSALIVPAIVISLVSFLETASSAKIESQRDGKRWNDNQDLLAQGLAKLASAFSGSFPTSTSFSRSAITLYAGGKTGWATIVTVAVVLLSLLFLTPLLYHVPKAVLAAVVVAAVAGLLKPRALPQLWNLGRVEALIAIATFAVTLLTSPRIYWGVLTGVLLGLAHFLYHRLHPRIIEVGLHPDGSMRDRHLWKLPPLAAGMYALRMDDELDFASASAFERAVIEQLSAHPDVRDVALFAHPINRIDATGVEVFKQVRALLRERGVTLHISGIKLPVEKVLLRAGALDDSPLLRMYRTDGEALAAFTRLSQAVTIQPSSGSSASGNP